MSIINVTEGPSPDTTAGIDGASASRIFHVQFDESDDPAIRPQLAWGAAGIPEIYQPHPFSSWLYVQNKTVRKIGGFDYEVTVNYTTSSKQDSNESELIDPLSRPPEIEWNFTVSNEKIDRDIEGKAIVNSAGESFDPPITKDVYDLVLRITRNQSNFNHLQAAEYIGAINSDYFYGFEPGMVRCTNYSGRKIRVGSLSYWQVTYEFQIRYAEVSGVNTGWKRRILDQGMHTYDGLDDEGYVKWKKIPVKDDKGNNVPTSEPFPLDGNGNKLPGARHTAREHEFEEFDIYPSLSFSILGLD